MYEDHSGVRLEVRGKTATGYVTKRLAACVCCEQVYRERTAASH
jgi:hypothetical protein